MSSHDIVVIGGGLAGLTAGLFAARHGRQTIVLMSAPPGGQLLTVDQIEGLASEAPSMAGYGLGPALEEEAAAQGAELRLATVEHMSRDGQLWQIATTIGPVTAPVVIVATGCRPARLGLAGEERLTGRGLSHCASCDGPLLRGRPAGVVGGGDAALQEALTLARFGGPVIVFHRRAVPTAQATYCRRAADQPSISFRPHTMIEELIGETALAGVRTRHLVDQSTEQVELAGLFVAIGGRPESELVAPWVTLAPTGHVPTDCWLRTTAPGLLAAGAVRLDSAAQAITAAGDGATAAIAAHRYLATGQWSRPDSQEG